MSAAPLDPANPLLGLPFEPSIESLGGDYWDPVEAAPFPRTQLRFRNDDLLHQLGLDPAAVRDGHLEEAYGRFAGRSPLLALRYHGYQFGTYNPFLGDGRGFLYGQLRDRHGALQDLGTKGSGTTPWSRGGDGRLTLKGGVREVIASEALHRLGVTTSRTLSLIEALGGDYWDPVEAAPFPRTHLRFGTCERLLYLRQPQQLERLLRHVVATYYPHLAAAHPVPAGGSAEPQLLAFYGALVERVARLAAEWMVAGFTHGVLNTDNMSLAGESFDYGPFAFLDRWDPGFTAAYFDHSGLYAYGRQPGICHQNLQLLQEPLAMLLPRAELAARLEGFAPTYNTHYRTCFLARLGLLAVGEAPTQAVDAPVDAAIERPDPVPLTLQLLAAWDVGYGAFFSALAERIARGGVPDSPEELEPFVAAAPAPPREPWCAFRDAWWTWARAVGASDPAGSAAPDALAARLRRRNLPEVPIRPVIERLWEAIDQRDDWEPLHQWLQRVRSSDGLP